jgi:hypothetical protein
MLLEGAAFGMNGLYALLMLFFSDALYLSFC